MGQESLGLSSDAKAIIEAVRAVQASQDNARVDLETRYEALQRELIAVQREMLAVSAVMKTGFPGGDLEGHRRYHEDVIDRRARSREFWRDILLNTAKGGTWAFVVGLFVYLVPLVGASIKEWLRQ